MKIVINTCYGGFCISHAAVMEYAKRKGISLTVEDDNHFGFKHYYTNPNKEEGSYFLESYIPRDDPILVEVVEAMGKDADGYLANLSVVEIPDGIKWDIHEYDGMEHVEEVHQTWS